MFDRSISLVGLLAWSLVVFGVALVIANSVAAHLPGLSSGGCILVLFGQLAMTHRLIRRLERREDAAFEHGRRSGMRSVQ